MSDLSTDITTWALNQQAGLDQVIVRAAETFYKDHASEPWLTFDVNECLREQFNLSSGKDLCYDRPSIGFTYSLWYHGKRVNGMLDAFLQLLVESRSEERIEIFDLGAGTGALQWAVGIVIAGMKAVGHSVPKVRIVNIDSSPFMLGYNRDYLWKEFLKSYPQCEDIHIDNQLISWVNPDDHDFTHVWLCASYLFDHSENQELIAEAFRDLAQEYKPRKIILFGNYTKRDKINKVARAVADVNYIMRSLRAEWNVFEGKMQAVTKARDQFATVDLNFTGIVEWENRVWYGRVLEPRDAELGLTILKEFNLYQKAEKNRAKIKPTPEQAQASRVSRSPTVILGPAGCGKSVVLTEKVKNIVEQPAKPYDPELNILLTTFNKELVRFLGNWLESILVSEKFTRTHDAFGNKELAQSYFTFHGSDYPNITVMHFDVLPTRVGSLSSITPFPQGRDYNDYHRDVMKRAMEAVVAEKKIDKGRHKSILDVEFLLEEYHRVKYGLQCHTIADYKNADRKGRGRVPNLGAKNKSARREYIARIFKRYKSLLSNDKCESFIIRRERFLKKLQKEGGLSRPFTHILVDELQDCCRADYDIFYALLQDPNELTVAGDLAQAINIGTVASVPRPQDEEMKRFQKIYLEGSFRLPFRIGECIRPLSEKIKQKFDGNADVYEIKPFKGAPPGARPIVIYDKEVAPMLEKLKQVFEAYRGYDETIEEINILENQHDLTRMLYQIGIPAEGHQVQRIKGMEKPFIVWDTFAGLNTTHEVEESVYTILTRTTSVVVILLRAKIKTMFIPIFQYLEEDRLIFWDEASRKVFQNLKNREMENDEVEEEADEELGELAMEDEEI